MLNEKEIKKLKRLLLTQFILCLFLVGYVIWGIYEFNQMTFDERMRELLVLLGFITIPFVKFGRYVLFLIVLLTCIKVVQDELDKF